MGSSFPAQHRKNTSTAARWGGSGSPACCHPAFVEGQYSGSSPAISIKFHWMILSTKAGDRPSLRTPETGHEAQGSTFVTANPSGKSADNGKPRRGGTRVGTPERERCKEWWRPCPCGRDHRQPRIICCYKQHTNGTYGEKLATRAREELTLTLQPDG